MYKHKDCFVIGAGFSHAYSAAAPLMRGFLARAIELGAFIPTKHDMLMPEIMRHMIGEQKTGGSHKELAEIASRYFGEFDDINIEQLATFLRADTAPYAGKEPRDRAYEQLLLVITNTLREIYSQPRTEATKLLFAEFANALVNWEIPIISFNYDLLLDQLLLDTRQWFPNDGYGAWIPIAGRYVAKSSDIGLNHKSLQSKTIFLKPHGSLNWGIREVGYEDGSHPIEVSHVMSDKERSIVVPISDMVTVGNDRLSINYRWRPFIVPPLANKSDEYTHSLIRTIWHKARDALSNSRNIYVLGYSLPPGDFEADSLFRESLFSFLPALEKRRIFFVNKDPDVNERIKMYKRYEVQVDTSISDVEECLSRYVEEFRKAPTKRARSERSLKEFLGKFDQDDPT